MTPREIQEDFMKTLGDESPSFSTVKNGLQNLSIDADSRSGRPKDVTTDENVEIVHNLIMVTGGETCEA